MTDAIEVRIRYWGNVIVNHWHGTISDRTWKRFRRRARMARKRRRGWA